MRDFSRSIMIGTCAVLAAGLVVAMPERAFAASAVPATSPSSEFPSSAGIEARNDSAARQGQPSIQYAAAEMDPIVACAVMPPMPQQASAQSKPMGAAIVGNAGGRVADGMVAGK